MQFEHVADVNTHFFQIVWKFWSIWASRKSRQYGRNITSIFLHAQFLGYQSNSLYHRHYPRKILLNISETLKRILQNLLKIWIKYNLIPRSISGRQQNWVSNPIITKDTFVEIWRHYLEPSWNSKAFASEFQENQRYHWVFSNLHR